MWEGIEDGQATKCNLSWLVQGMKSNSLLWVTDGSYDLKRTPVLSGVGRMDYFLSTHWQAPHGLLLGKVSVGKLLQSRASWPVLAPFISAGTVRVLQGIRLGSNIVL